MLSDSNSPTSPEYAQALRFRRAFLLLLVVGISVLFIAMTRRFLLAVLLAGVIAALSYSLFSWFLRRTGDRRGLAALITVLLLFLGLAVPLGGFFTLVVSEAAKLGEGAQEWFTTHGDVMERGRALAARIPLVDRVIPSTAELAGYVEEATERIGAILWGAAASATRGTVAFLLQLFIFLYALFFFYVKGPEVRDRVMGYIPLSMEEKGRLLERFTSVAKATLRGSVLIGVIQGGVAGLAFWVAGIPGAAFWGMVMIVFSILPAIGSAIVWIPAVVYLFMAGENVTAILLLIWCAVVAGSIDNLLRPLLIGKDAKMSDLMILLSTLGGIVLFGAVGFVVGPIVAALFVSVWQMYGEAFDAWLPNVGAVVLPSGKEVDAASGKTGASEVGP